MIPVAVPSGMRLPTYHFHPRNSSLFLGFPSHLLPVSLDHRSQAFEAEHERSKPGGNQEVRHSREDSAFSESMSSPQRDTEAAARPPSPAKLTGKAGPLVAPSATDPLSRCCTMRFGSTTQVLAKRMFKYCRISHCAAAAYGLLIARYRSIRPRTIGKDVSGLESMLSGYQTVLRAHLRWHTGVWHAPNAAASDRSHAKQHAYGAMRV